VLIAQNATTDPLWKSIAGAFTISANGTTTLAANSIGSTQINTSGVSRANIAAFAVASGQIDTSGIVRANLTNFIIGSTQIATGAVGTAQVLTTVIALQGQTNTWTGAQRFSTGGVYVQGWTAQSFSVGTLTGNNRTFTPTTAQGQFIHLVLGGNNLTGTFQFNTPTANSPTQILTQVLNSGVVSATFTTSSTYLKVDGNWTNTASAAFFFIATQSHSYNHLQIVPLQ